MSQSNRLYDEFARLVTDAAGVAQGVRREAETVMRGQLERLMADMDVVSREEFEAVREMARLAREENDRLSARIAALEAGAGAAGTPHSGSVTAKPVRQGKAPRKPGTEAGDPSI